MNIAAPSAPNARLKEIAGHAPSEYVGNVVEQIPLLK
jgi:hypothetical protein